MYRILTVSLSTALFFSMEGAVAPAAAAQLKAEDCAKIQDRDDRLRCYDQIFQKNESVAPAASSPSVDVQAEAPAADTTASAPSAPEFRDENDYVRVKKAELEDLRRKAKEGEKFKPLPREAFSKEIIGVFKTGYNTINFVLENGETWRQIDPPSGRKPRKGDIANIKPGLLGSWTVQYGSRRSKFKVHRLGDE